MKKKILLFLFSVLTFPLLAQTVKISGTVFDSENKPIELAAVQVKNTLNGTITDFNGKYILNVTPGDSVTLLFSCLGYNKAERIIPQLTSKVTLNVRMREWTTQLSEITVTASKKQTSTVQSLDAERVKLLPDPAGGTIESLIVTFAGVTSKNELSSQYSVRGGNYDENIVYVNGIEVYRPLLIRSGEQEGLSFINPNMTGKVGFSAGGFDAKYGDRMSSVLDIEYKKPETFEASVSASLLGGSAYVGGAGKNYTHVSGLRYKSVRPLLGTLDTKGEYEPTFIDFQTYLTYNFSPVWEVGFLGNFSRNSYKFTPITRSTSFGTLAQAQNFKVYFDGWEKDLFNTLFGAFTLKRKINNYSHIGVQASVFNSKEHETYDINGEYWLNEINIDKESGRPQAGDLLGIGTYHDHARNKLDATVATLALFGNHSFDTHKIQWGISANLEKISDKISEWEMRDSAGYSLPHDGKTVNVFSNLYASHNLHTHRFSGYVQDMYKFRIPQGMFTITAGLRGSYWTFNNEFIASPRASLAFVPNQGADIALRFATGMYYQSPFYKEFRKTVTESGNSFVELNKEIKSQKSIHFVLGGDYYFRTMDRPFKFTAEAYYKILSNLIPYTVDNVKIRYYGENLSSGKAMGLDMKFFGEFVPGTDSWLSFSLMKAEQTLNGVNVPLPSDQRYNISLYFQDYFPGYKRVKLNLKGLMSQGLPVSAPHQGYDKGYFRSPDYRRVDMGISWQALHKESNLRYGNRFWGTFKNIWIGVDLFNLFDINNINAYYWISDVYNQQYAVPNYLTGRQLNFRILAEF